MGLYGFTVVSGERRFPCVAGTVGAPSVGECLRISLVDHAEARASVDGKIRPASATGHGADGGVDCNQLLHQLDVLTSHIHLKNKR